MSGKGRALVSLISVNNETGAIENIASLAKVICAEAGEGALIHVDAVSSGYCPIRFAEWNVDYLSLSAHKVGGPQGVGALIAKYKGTFLLSTPTFCMNYIRKIAKEDLESCKCAGIKPGFLR